MNIRQSAPEVIAYYILARAELEGSTAYIDRRGEVHVKRNNEHGTKRAFTPFSIRQRIGRYGWDDKPESIAADLRKAIARRQMIAYQENGTGG